MSRKVGFYEPKESYRLFKSVLTDTIFFDMDYLCFCPDKQINFSKIKPYRRLTQRHFVDELLKVHFDITNVFLDVTELVVFLSKNNVFDNFSNKTVVFKYITSIYKVVNKYIIQYNKGNIKALIAVLSAAKDKYEIVFKDKIINIVLPYNLQIDLDELTTYKNILLSLHFLVEFSLGIDLDNFYHSIKDNEILNITSSEDITYKSVFITNVIALNFVHQNPHLRKEERFIDNLAKYLNQKEIESLPIFLEHPKKCSDKLYALLTNTLKKSEVSKEELLSSLEIIDNIE